MFSRAQRINSLVLTEILTNGPTVKSAHFSMVMIKKGTAILPKIAVIVSRKTASKAVVRHKLRRQARAWVKNLLSSWRPQPGTFLVIFVNRAWQGPFPSALQVELKNLLSKINILV